MLQKIGTVLRAHCCLDPASPVVVGVSGGPDSLCLVHVMHVLGYPLIVAHLDHQLRPESAADAVQVAAVADAVDSPFVAQRADVAAHAEAKRLSIEEAARELRYEFLFGVARQHSAQAVAVGHTADDQVETVLMHLIRGAGMGGLKGMAYRSALTVFDAATPLVRPLLGTWRRETLEYCRSNSLTPIHDKTNESLEYFRNRIRHELIPLLETYNPQVREAIWRTAETMASDLALLDDHVRDAWQRTVLRQTSGFVCFGALELARQPLPLQRRLVRMAATHLLASPETDFAAAERAVAFIANDSSTRLDLGGGLSLSREGESIFVSLGEDQLPEQDWPQMPPQASALSVHIPLNVPLANGWQFSAEYVPTGEAPLELVSKPMDEFSIYLDAAALPASLELRPPRPGDRLQPLGLKGRSQKLSDLFANSKLPRRARTRWPVLCSGTALVWVPGFRPAESFRLQATSSRAAHFSVFRPG